MCVCICYRILVKPRVLRSCYLHIKKLSDFDHLFVTVVLFLLFPFFLPVLNERLTGMFGEMLWFCVLHTHLFVQELMQILLSPMDSICLSRRTSLKGCKDMSENP